mgnify:CR=1 FL=1
MEHEDIFSQSQWQRISNKITAEPKQFPDSYISDKVREHVWNRDEGFCIYCKEPATDCDHVIPASHGGPGIKENIVLSYQSCNLSKRSSFDIKWLITAFYYLTLKGENINWIEKTFLNYEDEETHLEFEEKDQRRRNLTCLNCNKRFSYYGNPEYILFCSDDCELIYYAKSFCPICNSPILSNDTFCSQMCEDMFEDDRFCWMCHSPLWLWDRSFKDEDLCSDNCKYEFKEEFKLDPDTGLEEDEEIEFDSYDSNEDDD